MGLYHRFEVERNEMTPYTLGLRLIKLVNLGYTAFVIKKEEDRYIVYSFKARRSINVKQVLEGKENG